MQWIVSKITTFINKRQCRHRDDYTDSQSRSDTATFQTRNGLQLGASSTDKQRQHQQAICLADGTGCPSTTAAISGMTTGQLPVAASATTVTSSIAYATANTASTVVERDGSGNFSAGTITAALTGAVNGVTLSNSGAATSYLDKTGNYSTPAGAGTVTTSGSPVSPNIAAFSSGTAITAATSANIQTAIGAGVYDASGAAAARQANLSLLPGTYTNGDMCTYASTGTLLNCNTAIPSVGTWGALNYPPWASGTPFVKMTAAGTFALDTNTYLTSLSGALLATGATTGATSQAQVFTDGVTLSNLSSYSGNLASIGSGGALSDSGIAASNVPLLNAANTFTATNTFNNATYSALFTGGNVGIGTTGPGDKF